MQLVFNQDFASHIPQREATVENIKEHNHILLSSKNLFLYLQICTASSDLLKVKKWARQQMMQQAKARTRLAFIANAKEIKTKAAL